MADRAATASQSISRAPIETLKTFAYFAAAAAGSIDACADRFHSRSGHAGTVTYLRDEPGLLGSGGVREGSKIYGTTLNQHC